MEIIIVQFYWYAKDRLKVHRIRKYAVAVNYEVSLLSCAQFYSQQLLERREFTICIQSCIYSLYLNYNDLG